MPIASDSKILSFDFCWCYIQWNHMNFIQCLFWVKFFMKSVDSVQMLSFFCFGLSMTKRHLKVMINMNCIASLKWFSLMPHAALILESCNCDISFSFSANRSHRLPGNLPEIWCHHDSSHTSHESWQQNSSKKIHHTNWYPLW